MKSVIDAVSEKDAVEFLKAQRRAKYALWAGGITAALLLVLVGGILIKLIGVINDTQDTAAANHEVVCKLSTVVGDLPIRPPLGGESPSDYTQRLHHDRQVLRTAREAGCHGIPMNLRKLNRGPIGGRNHPQHNAFKPEHHNDPMPSISQAAQPQPSTSAQSTTFPTPTAPPSAGPAPTTPTAPPLNPPPPPSIPNVPNVPNVPQVPQVPNVPQIPPVSIPPSPVTPQVQTPPIQLPQIPQLPQLPCLSCILGP